ncbi:MAG: hypothetical protein E6G97_22010 [Alphaproteobacteria bacterium]|nr:MAG: hypothetical protein E6G97_22010 [Alphaproteobacteria bacterium]
MRLVCAPADHPDLKGKVRDIGVVLYDQPKRHGQGSAGASTFNQIRRRGLQVAPKAWDFLSLALSVVAADGGISRAKCVDGWTRTIALRVAVNDPAFWTAHTALAEKMLRFLTTDVWTLEFTGGGMLPAPPKVLNRPAESCVALLSGGLDSLVGALDLAAAGTKPFLVSQVATGDKQNQKYFATKTGGGLTHLQLNHNANCPGANERSQRSRSIIFYAYAILAASALARHEKGDVIPLYASENGLISINPPLTPARLGSLSTRTTHPIFIAMLQQLLDAAGLRVRIENPYQFKTKGEMLKNCADQDFLRKFAHTSTSCGRYGTFGFKHCGRCVPCMIRRAAFLAWGHKDNTKYVYETLGKDDDEHARFDDVRSAAVAVAALKSDGIDDVLGASLSSPLLDKSRPYKQIAKRGLAEVGDFLADQGVK